MYYAIHTDSSEVVITGTYTTPKPAIARAKKVTKMLGIVAEVRLMSTVVMSYDLVAIVANGKVVK